MDGMVVFHGVFHVNRGCLLPLLLIMDTINEITGYGSLDPLTFFWDDEDVEWTSSRETGPIDMIYSIYIYIL